MSELKEPPRLALSGQDRNCVVLTIEGMTCGHCANTVEGELAAVSGVVSAEANEGAGTAKVVGSASLSDLQAAVERAGYRVRSVGDGRRHSATVLSGGPARDC